MNSQKRVRVASLFLLLIVLVFRSFEEHNPTSLGDFGSSLKRPPAWDVKATPRIQKTAAMVIQRYVEHKPIRITNNADFAALGFPGAGTEDNPYVIAGLNITNEKAPLIWIEETTVHFQIQNNLLIGVNFPKKLSYNEAGIFLGPHMKHGTIDSNIITNCTRGILVYESDHNIVTNNTISNCAEHGIQLMYSEQSTVTYNMVSNCMEIGIDLYMYGQTIVLNNTVTECQEGIFLRSSWNNIMAYNTISHNQGYGISIEPRELWDNWDEPPIPRYNTVMGNDFLSNNLGGPSQAFDNGIKNVFVENYWDIHENTDQNADGIADTPYSIAGEANNQDLSPLADRASSRHLFKPIIIDPNGGETLRGTVTIQWLASYDSWEHSITYAVSYSPDDGQTWIPLVSGLSAPVYEWDTTTVADGPTYLVKVDSTCSNGLMAEDHSNAPFTIQNRITTIVITNNDDFATFSFPGEGTEENPYLIEGFNITSINIRDTTAYFCIRNNIIKGSWPMEDRFTTRKTSGYGISLYNVVHGTITTNFVTNCSYGIYLHWKSQATVTNNIVSNNTVAIYLHQTSENNVTHNTVSHCGVGILLEVAEQNTLTHNTVSNCGEAGIYLWDSGQNTLIDNTMLNTGLVIQSVWPEHLTQARVENNTVNGKLLVYWQQVDGGMVPLGAGQIILINSKGVEIMGQNISHTSVGVYTISSSNLNIHHNTFLNNSQAAIHLDRSWDNTVAHNTISNCEETGIRLEDAEQSTLTENTVSYCEGAGIHLEDAEQSILTHNIVSYCEEGGIYLSFSGQSTLTQNTVSDCEEAGIKIWMSEQNTIVDNTLINNGLDIYDSYSQTAVTDNVVNGRSLVYWKNVRDKTVPLGAGQVILLNCDKIEVTGQDLSRASIGLFAVYSTHLNIHHNIVSNNSEFGIWLDDSDEATITHNTISDGGQGITLWGSSQATVTNNTVSNCGRVGIKLWGSEHSIVAHNIVFNCRMNGIDLWVSGQTTVAYNTVTNCEHYGINLDGGESPSNSILHNNTITNNTRGINFDRASNNIVVHNTIINNTEYGIALSHIVTPCGLGVSCRWDSDDNTVNENDFLGNNPRGSSQAFDEGENNAFAHNYWDDHDKTDLNDDGIADIPYSIAGEAANHDMTPLTAFANPHRFPPLESYSNPRVPVGILIVTILLVTIMRRKKQKSR